MFVLTVAPLDLGAHHRVNYMGRVCRKFATTGGRTQVPVMYPARLDSDGTGSIAAGADNLDQAIRDTPGDKIVLGYSQGAQVVGAWLRKYAYSAGSPDNRDLQFLLIGNPERRFGKQPWTKRITLDNTKYTVRDVSRRGDKWANFQGKPTDNRILAMFGGTHTNYWDTDPYDPAAEVINTVGRTTYVLVP